MNPDPSHQFRIRVRSDDAIMRDHRVHDVRIMPGVTFLDIVCRAADRSGLGKGGVEIRRLLFPQPFCLPANVERWIQIRLHPSNGHWLLNASSTAADGTSDVQEHARGELHAVSTSPGPTQPPTPTSTPAPTLDLAALRRNADSVSRWEELYGALEKLGIRHGPFMRPSGQVFRGSGYVLAEMALSSEAEPYAGRFRFAPPFLDAATGIAYFSGTARARYSGRPCVPLFLERFVTGNRSSSGNRVWVYLPFNTDPRPTGSADFSSDPRIDLYSAAGEWLAGLEGLAFKQVRSPSSIRDLIAPSRSEVRDPETNASTAVAGSDTAPRPPIRGDTDSDSDSEIDGTHSSTDSETVVLAVLKTLTAETGGLERGALDERTGFYDLGLDSSHLLQIAARLEGIIGGSLYPTLLFEYPTLKQLAEYLAEHHGAAFRKHRQPNDDVDENLDCESDAVEFNDGPATAGDAGKTAIHDVRSATHPLHRFNWTWTLAGPIPDTVTAPVEPLDRDDATAVLVFGRHPTLTAELRGIWAGRRVFNVVDGAGFEAGTDGNLSARPGSTADMSALLGHLANLGSSVVHAVAVAEPRAAGGPPWSGTKRDIGPAERAGQVLASVQSVLRLVQTVLGARSTLPVRMIVPHSNSAIDRLAGAAIAGLAASLRREHPQFNLRTLGTGSVNEPADLARQIASEEHRTDSTEIRFDHRGRWIRQVSERAASGASAATAASGGRLIRRRGVYWITGGAGGIGRILARRLIRDHDATVILTGRTERNDGGTHLDGAQYMTADVTDAAAMRRVVEEIRRRFGRLDGVLHAAGVLRDGLTMNLSESALADALNPKIGGALVLDEVTRDEPLDLFMLFGSLSSIVGNPGQSAYTAANRCLAGFADWRQSMVAAGERRGATVCCHWPLWRDGGMKVTERVQQRLFAETGMTPLDEMTGWNLFLEAARADTVQCVGIAGDRSRLTAHLRTVPFENGARSDSPSLVLSGTESVPPTRPAGSDPDEPIAIVGLSGRYPGADNLNAFWENLAAGRDSISEIPAERWDYRRYPSRDGASGVPRRWGGFLGNVDRFDALFFRIAPREAIRMDPQERLFLEVAWNAVEHAGYRPGSLDPESVGSSGARVGVFVGVMWGDYQKFGAEELARGRVVNAGSPFWSIANRVSYCMNFSGPSLAVDSACSSSLTAIHLACESLRRGECRAAVAGGVNLSLHPGKYLLLTELEMLSSDGRCRSFGEGGDGYVPGEGVGALVLKPLRAAVADGDTVHAVIRASGINHDGRGGGYTVPNPRAQAALIGGVLNRAGISPNSLGYIEAHGTGTALGDPVEISGLARAFGGELGANRSCAIGSVKSNIGHLESAAGVAAISKVVLQLQHRQLVPSLHSDSLNAKIDFNATPFRVQTRLEPWRPVPSDTTLDSAPAPLRAGVSSFGAGGANAHVVLEEAPATARPDDFRPAPVLLLSAANRDRLMALARRWFEFLEESHGEAHFRDALFTAQVGREPAPERLAIAADSRARVLAGLTAFLEGQDSPDYLEGVSRANGARGQGLQIDPAANPAMHDAAAWINGADVDWRQLARGVPRRIPCPTYPFAGKRYWIDTTKSGATDLASSNHAAMAPSRSLSPNPAADANTATAAPDSDSNSNSDPADILCFKPVWRLAPASNEGREHPTPLIVFDTDEALSRELATRWNGSVARVISGSHWRQTHGGALEIDPGCEDHFARLWKEFASAGETLSILVRGPEWPRSGSAPGESGCDEWLDPWYFLGRSLGAANVSARLFVVRPETVEVEAAGGAVDGFLNALHREHPRIVSQTMRIDLSEPRSAARILASEFRSVSRSRHVRHRAEVRDTLTWELFDPESEQVPENHRIQPRARGTYLMTGGVGGIGHQIASFLARHYAANLVLVGRTSLPPEDDWETAATASSTPPEIRQRLVRLNELKRHGGQIVYAGCDVADADSLRRVLDLARDRFGPLHGVLHAAGLTEDRALAAKPLESWRRVLVPKIAGARVLDDLTRSDHLDFFFLFSSIAPVIGNLGQCDYAAANGFLDGFTTFREHQRARGRRHGRTRCLNWPLWTGGGMTTDTSTAARAFQRAGLASLQVATGIRLFEQSLNTLPPRWLILAGDSRRLKTWLPEVAEGARFSGSADAPTSAGMDSEVASRRVGRASDYLARLLVDVLKLDREDLDPDTSFEAFGIDSVATRELVQRVNRDWNDVLDPFILAEHNTLRSLATHLAQLDEGPDSTEASRAEPETIPIHPRGHEEGNGNGNGHDSGSDSDHGHGIRFGNGDREAPTTAASVRAESDRVSSHPVPVPAVSGATDSRVDIAVVGMACRFPGSTDLESFWNDLRDGRCRIGEIPAERRRMMGRFVFEPGEPGPGASYSKWAGFLDDPALFDPEYFGLSEREARVMDPVHRLFLETSARALENTGWAPNETHGGSGGIFVGARQGAYAGLVGAQKLWENDPAGAWHYNAACMIASRAARTFDWTGPAAVIDTACSSSLVAVHLACESLRRGECDRAIAGGADLLLSADDFVQFSQSRSLSPDGRCRPFESGANGTVLGEGCGVVVLKRLDRARADGDRIQAIVRGSAMNHDGAGRGGAAKVEAFKRVMRDAAERANVDFGSMGYLELHGEGSLLRDAAELRAIREIWREDGSRRGAVCPIGSVKTNIGHLLLASGVAGFIKTCLAVSRGVYPRHTHPAEPARFADLTKTPYRFALENRPWGDADAPDRRPRIAGVHSTGIADTNCFVVCEENVLAGPDVAPTLRPMNRRRFWLGPAADPGASDDEPDERRSVLGALRAGTLTLAQARAHFESTGDHPDTARAPQSNSKPDTTGEDPRRTVLNRLAKGELSICEAERRLTAPGSDIPDE